MLNNRLRIFLLLAAAGFIFACSTVPEAEPVVDYSDERSILYEVGRTRTMLDNEPVKALLKAVLLV